MNKSEYIKAKKRLANEGYISIPDAQIPHHTDKVSAPSNGLGLKYDQGKLLFGCFTRGLASVIRVLVAVLTYGAQKYQEDSWQTVPDAKRRYLDAADRHFNDYRCGNGFDKESGLHHLAHTAINVMFALYFEMQEDADKGVPRDFTSFKNPKDHNGQ